MALRNKVAYFSHPSHQLQKMFEEEGVIVTQDIWDDPEFIVFTPGEDVSPFLYGERKIKSTHTDFMRDMKENRLYRELEIDIPKIGIGRGAQFLNVMTGGRMYQHCPGHANNHYIHNLLTDTEITVTSFHHQCMIVPETTDVIWACNMSDFKQTAGCTFDYDIHGNDTVGLYMDVEVAFNMHTTSLLFQPRPEMGHFTTKRLLLDTIEEWIEPFFNKKEAL